MRTEMADVFSNTTIELNDNTQYTGNLFSGQDLETNSLSKRIVVEVMGDLYVQGIITGDFSLIVHGDIYAQSIMHCALVKSDKNIVVQHSILHVDTISAESIFIKDDLICADITALGPIRCGCAYVKNMSSFNNIYITKGNLFYQSTVESNKLYVKRLIKGPYVTNEGHGALRVRRRINSQNIKVHFFK